MTTGESHPVYVGPDTLVWWKESGLPTVPLKGSTGETLFSIVSREYPEVALCSGRNPWEGGVMHRLDTLTSGLVLIARTEEAFQALLEEQRRGNIVKEYRAECSEGRDAAEGFPPFPYGPLVSGRTMISSHFRSYGPGQKSVRPVLPGPRAQGPVYRTEVLPDGGLCFRCRLERGFRHQVRAHLAWAGFPILGDTQYGGTASGVFGLEAVAVSYTEPSTGKRLTVRS